MRPEEYVSALDAVLWDLQMEAEAEGSLPEPEPIDRTPYIGRILAIFQAIHAEEPPPSRS